MAGDYVRWVSAHRKALVKKAIEKAPGLNRYGVAAVIGVPPAKVAVHWPADVPEPRARPWRHVQLDVIDTLYRAGRPVFLAYVAEDCGRGRAEVYRCLRTLIERGDVVAQQGVYRKPQHEGGPKTRTRKQRAYELSPAASLVYAHMTQRKAGSVE